MTQRPLEQSALDRAEPRPDGRVARRKAAYYAAIAASSDYRARLDGAPRPLPERARAWA